MEKTVIGLFETRAKAEMAVQELIQRGSPRDNVRIEDGEDAYTRMQSTLRTDKDSAVDHDEGFFSGLRNFFEDLGLIDPDGSRPGELSSRGTSRELEAIHPGEVLVVVKVDDRMVDTAADILNKYGAIETDTRRTSEMNVSEVGGYTTNKSQTASTGSTASKVTSSSAGNTGSAQTTIPVMEEELEIGKRAVTRGGVRIYTRMVEKPVEKDIRLKEETVHVERHAVDRPVSENELNTFKDGTIEVKEMAEKAVVAKRARVKEEITVSKETTERSEKVHDTVRKTEVDVSKVNPQEDAKLAQYESEFRKNFEKTYATRGMNYKDVLPVYQYGYKLGKNPKYHKDEWSVVESQIRRDWDQQHYGPWESLKDAVRTGWERAVHA